MGKESQALDGVGLFLSVQRSAHNEQGRTRVLLFSRFFRAWMTLQTSLNHRFLPFCMSAQEADVLLRCVELGTVNPGRLAILLEKDKGKITRFIDRLEAQKLVTQKINPRDRRYFLIRPTAKGKKTAQELERLFESVRNELFAGMTERELCQLNGILAVMQANAAAIRSRSPASSSN